MDKVARDYKFFSDHFYPEKEPEYMKEEKLSVIFGWGQTPYLRLPCPPEKRKFN